jgi:glucose-1-phosphate adenylyltransferase
MLKAKEKMYAYPFDGYWKDVGTLDSLWEANMDLLGENPVLSLNDQSWKIYSRTTAEPPQFVGKEAYIKNSLVTSGCEVYGTVENSVLFAGVTVHKGAYVKDSVVMNNCVIKQNSSIIYSIVDENVIIGQNATVGKEKQSGAKLTILGSGTEIADNEVIKDGEIITKAARQN